MNTFKLKIVTPDGEKFSNDATSIILRGKEGDVQILASHADYFTSLGEGKLKITLPDGKVRLAAASGGFISVSKEEVTVVATTIEYSDEIDVNRALLAKEKAEEKLRTAKEEKEILLAKAKLRRALVRLSVADGK